MAQEERKTNVDPEGGEGLDEIPARTTTFEKLYSQYYQDVFAFCYKVLQSYAQAMDVSARMWGRIRNRGAENADWQGDSIVLLRTAARECIAYLRERGDEGQPDATVEDPAFLDAINLDVMELRDLAARAEEDARIRQAMRHLSPKQRVALVLKYHHRMPNPDIAEILDCGMGTALTHLRCALLMAAPIFSADGAA